MLVIRVFAGWVAAVVLASLLGSAIQTQYNLAALAGLDVSIGLAARLESTAHDLWHFAPLYGALVAVSFFVAWPVAGWLARRRPDRRPAWFTLAGTAAVAVMLVTMNAVLPITPVARPGTSRRWC
jgi:hypothetical protein